MQLASLVRAAFAICWPIYTCHASSIIPHYCHVLALHLILSTCTRKEVRPFQYATVVVQGGSEQHPRQRGSMPGHHIPMMHRVTHGRSAGPGHKGSLKQQETVTDAATRHRLGQDVFAIRDPVNSAPGRDAQCPAGTARSRVQMCCSV